MDSMKKDFFKICDLFFTDYKWNENHLKTSLAFAGQRAEEVFHGVDVFGRGSFEGGQLNTWKAVQKCVSLGLSVALFAPGWSYENSGGLEAYESFRRADDSLWNGLSSRVIKNFEKFDEMSNSHGSTWQILNENPRVFM